MNNTYLPDVRFNVINNNFLFKIFIKSYLPVPNLFSKGKVAGRSPDQNYIFIKCLAYGFKNFDKKI